MPRSAAVYSTPVTLPDNTYQLTFYAVVRITDAPLAHSGSAWFVLNGIEGIANYLQVKILPQSGQIEVLSQSQDGGVIVSSDADVVAPGTWGVLSVTFDREAGTYADAVKVWWNGIAVGTASGDWNFTPWALDRLKYGISGAPNEEHIIRHWSLHPGVHSDVLREANQAKLTELLITDF